MFKYLNFMFFPISVSNGTSIEYILSHLIATTSYFLNDTVCQVFNTLNFGFSEFTALIAFPSRSKTVATTIFSKSHRVDRTI